MAGSFSVFGCSVGLQLCLLHISPRSAIIRKSWFFRCASISWIQVVLDQIRSDQIRSAIQPCVSLGPFLLHATHTVLRSVGQFSILFSQMCAGAQQFSHRSCQTCQTVTNDIKLDQLNIKGTFKTKTGNNQRIKFETSLFTLHFVKTTCFATI